MPISTVTNRTEYQGDGTSAVFAWQFPLHAQSHLGVFAFNSSSSTPGLITPMTLNGAGGFGFTLSGNADASGIYPNGVNIVVNSAPNAQTVLVAFRSSILTNTFSVPQSGSIPSTALNNEIDYLTLLAQRHQDQITRSTRLHDGLAGSFDTSLPANIRTSALKRLMVNSSGTGWTFDESVGAYIQNTLIYASTNSSLVSLGGSPDGRVLLSRGSSAPEWALLNLGSTASVTGTLPIGNGGTGQASNLTIHGVIFATTATQMASIVGGTPGYVLTYNGSSAPNWQPVNIGSGTIAAGAIVGVLAVGNGGTGTGTSYIQYGVVFASSTTEMANTAAGGGDVPLMGNAGAAPSFRPLPLVTGSSTSGILPLVKGGTGTDSSFVQYGIVYSQDSTRLGVIPSAAEGRILTAHGSAAPTFDAFSATNINSGVVAVANGGTGAVSIAPQFSLLTASSTTQVGALAPGGSDVPLVGNTGSFPSYRALPLSSGSSVTGTLGVARGGTNLTSYTSGAILFGSSTTAIGQAVVGINQVVIGGGSSAPSAVSGYGNSGDVLTSQGAGLAPQWSASAGGTAASQAEMEAGSSIVRIVTPARQHFHPSAAKVYARVTIVGSTTPTVASSSSFNVSSVSDVGVGLFTLNFTTPLSSGAYCPTALGDHQLGTRAVLVQVLSGSSAPTASTCSFATTDNLFAPQDSFGFLGVAIFGDQ